MRTRILAGMIAALAAVAAFAVPAAASPLVDVTASPETIAVGGSSTITATGFGGIDSIRFDVTGDPGGTLAGGGTSAEVPVTDGTATTTFSASQGGTFTIEVVDGEAVLAIANILVTSPAPPTTQTTLVASPESVAVGEESTITATGLGELTTARFGLDATPGGSLTGSDGTSTSVAADVTGGEASVTFASTETGIFTVAVGDGETVYAVVTVTVTEGAQPSETPTSTPSPSATSAAGEGEDGGFPAVWVWVIVGAVVVAAGVVTIVLLRRRNRAQP